MNYPQIKTNIKRRSTQAMQMKGINLTDTYGDGQMESSKGIGTDRYPYISTVQNLKEINAGVSEGYQAVSMYPWERLFVVSNEPGSNGGFKCFYGGTYCGDALNLDLPKQFAVVNSKLVMWPDKVMFDLKEETIVSQNMNTAPTLMTVTSGTIEYRKAVQ